jgi:NhaA family Na+:H+ antiporter
MLAAAGGVVARPLIYLAINGPAGGHLEGWPTPDATDIAFALAALAAPGGACRRRCGSSCMTLAIADDLVAVVLIAALYTEHLRFPDAGRGGGDHGGAGGHGALAHRALRLLGLGGLLLWGFTLKSGVNTSLAGIAAPFCLPLEPKRPGGQGVLARDDGGAAPLRRLPDPAAVRLHRAGFTFGSETPRAPSHRQPGRRGGAVLRQADRRVRRRGAGPSA